MIRKTLFLATALLGLTSIDADAAEVSISYKGVVTQANGAQASSFQPGQEIKIRYVLESTAVDSNANASAGVYLNGLNRLDVAISGPGVSVSTGPGIVQTFNDVGSDQAFFYSSTSVNGSIGGLPVTSAEVDFVDFDVDTNGRAAMLSSDAIPTTHLITTDNSISFQTSAGFTYIRFLAEPEITCASEGYTGTKLTWCQNICEKGYTGSTLDMWIHRWISRFHTLPACAAPTTGN